MLSYLEAVGLNCAPVRRNMFQHRPAVDQGTIRCDLASSPGKPKAAPTKGRGLLPQSKENMLISWSSMLCEIKFTAHRRSLSCSTSQSPTSQSLGWIWGSGSVLHEISEQRPGFIPVFASQRQLVPCLTTRAVWLLGRTDEHEKDPTSGRAVVCLTTCRMDKPVNNTTKHGQLRSF